MKRQFLQPLMAWFILLTIVLALLNVALPYILGLGVISFAISVALYVRKVHLVLVVPALLICILGVAVNLYLNVAPIIKLGIILLASGLLISITLSFVLKSIFTRILPDTKNSR